MTTTFSYTGGFYTGSGGVDGLTVNAYKASRLSGNPGLNGSPPGGSPDATATTADASGFTGSYVLALPTSEGYYISVSYDDVLYWEGPVYGSPVLPDYLALNSLIGASSDPLAPSATALTGANATLYTATVVAHGTATSNLWLDLSTAGNKGSSGAGGAAVYLWNATGGAAVASLTTSAVDTALTTGAVAELAWAGGPIALTPGSVYIVGLWLPTNWSGGTSAAGPILRTFAASTAINNINCVSPTFRAGATSGGTISTTLPGTITSGVAPWFGIS